MRHTIKLDAAKGIQVEEVGANVVIRLQTFGLTVMQQNLEPDQAAAIGNAMIHAANAAHVHQHHEAGHV